MRLPRYEGAAVLACPVPVLFRTRISVALSPLKSKKAAICPDRSKRFMLWVTLENCNAITGHMKTSWSEKNRLDDTNCHLQEQ